MIQRMTTLIEHPAQGQLHRRDVPGRPLDRDEGEPLEDGAQDDGDHPGEAGGPGREVRPEDHDDAGEAEQGPGDLEGVQLFTWKEEVRKNGHDERIRREEDRGESRADVLFTPVDQHERQAEGREAQHQEHPQVLPGEAEPFATGPENDEEDDRREREAEGDAEDGADAPQADLDGEPGRSPDDGDRGEPGDDERPFRFHAAGSSLQG